MPRFVAFLRGVSPQNCQMAPLRKCLEDAGLKNVRTVLSSGNAAFDARSMTEARLELQLEKVLEDEFGRAFYPIVRSSSFLAELLASDPYAKHAVPKGAKRVVSFLRAPTKSKVALPLTEDRATVLYQHGREVFTAYLPSDQGPVFMKLLERAYGKEITTRTWDTVSKCAAA